MDAVPDLAVAVPGLDLEQNALLFEPDDRKARYWRNAALALASS